MRCAEILVSGELLAQVLRLPEGTRVMSRFGGPDGPVRLLVEHDDLPEYSGRVPMARPTFRDSGNGAEFIGWGDVR